MILILLPLVLILALVIGCWIKAVSPGTVLFRQKRVGLGGKIFTMYKFRSMSPLADTSPHEAHVEHLIKSGRPMFKLDATGDRRLIKGGRTIRMAGLDELPQLINVLRGEMSLVGPRPCTSNEFALYNANQLDRFSVPPGLTGLWQIRRNASTTFRGMVDMDDEYVAGLSPWLDFKIVMATPAAIVGQLGRSARGMVAGRSAAGAEWTPRRTAMLHTAYLNGATGTQKLAD